MGARWVKRLKEKQCGLRRWRRGSPSRRRTRATHAPVTRLSERECDAFHRLPPPSTAFHRIAARHSSSESAELLAISPTTVKRPGGNVRCTAQLADRMQAAILRWREGIAQER